MISQFPKLVRLTALILISGCAGQVVAVRGPVAPTHFSHPGLANVQSVYLKLYRATPDGILVAGLYPDAKVDPDRNPGTVMSFFSFTADPSVHGSYFWHFADGVTLLDGTCVKTDKAGLLAAAARPGGVSVQFVTFHYADQRNWAPPAVHVFDRTLQEPSDCSNVVIADPAFAPATH